MTEEARTAYVGIYTGIDPTTEALEAHDAPPEALADWSAFVDTFWGADIHPAILAPADDPTQILWQPDLSAAQAAEILELWSRYRAWGEYLEQLEEASRLPDREGGDGGLGVAPWPGAGTTLSLAIWATGALFFVWQATKSKERDR